MKPMKLSEPLKKNTMFRGFNVVAKKMELFAHSLDSFVKNRVVVDKLHDQLEKFHKSSTEEYCQMTTFKRIM